MHFNYYLIICILLFILFIYSQVRVHRLYNTDYQILQAHDPEKNVLEDTLKQKYPTILMDVVIGWKGIRDVVPETMESKKLNKDPKFKKLLKQYMKFYNIPLSISQSQEIKLYKAGDTNYITFNSQFRFYIIQLYGHTRVVLFSPKEANYLYPTTDKKYSKINFWKLDYWDKQLEGKNKKTINDNPELKKIEDGKNKYLDDYPKFNKAKYIEIYLSAGQILYIPYKWWYSCYSVDESMRITATSRSLFSW